MRLINRRRPTHTPIDDEQLETKVFEALGTASVCWESMEGTGVFDSTLARKTGDELVAWIQAHHPRPIDRDEIKAVVMTCGPDPAPAEVADAVCAYIAKVGA